MSGLKILITGASGFLGTHLCRRLCQKGWEVHAVSRSQHSTSNGGPRWWQGDLADTSTARGLLLTIKPDIIFHLASHVFGSRDLSLVMPTFRSNLMTTVNLLTAASEIGCQRIVLTGSLEEPEPGDPQAIPSSPYAVAKWASNAYARMFNALYQLPVVILRVFMVYGPEQQDLQKLIPYVTLSLLRGESPKLASGQRKIDWVYVEDVVQAFLLAGQAAGIEGSIIDIGSGELVSIRSVVDYLVRLINPQIEPSFGALADRPLEQVRVADRERTLAVLGWQRMTSLENGLKRTVDWYRQQLAGQA
jgi:UDP-glucose 4-epimerase